MPRLVFSREEINTPDATHWGLKPSARIKEYIMKKIVYAAIAAAPAAAVGGGAKLVFDADAKRLTLSGGTLTPSDAAALAEYTLKIALKTDKKSTLFTLPAGKGTGLADGAVLELGSILSADFFDTEITFIGFVFALEEKDTANDYTVHHWTIPVALPVVEGAGKVTGQLRSLWRRLARLRTRCCGV